jgi:molybdate transport system substrate-binding protein
VSLARGGPRSPETPTGPPVQLHLLSAGAAQGLVEALQEDFHAQIGASLRATFGAVGAIKEKLDSGVPCDALILTALMIAALEGERRVLSGTSAPLGRVRTGVAVRSADVVPAIADRDELRAALLGASRIHVPDTRRATAGIHFAAMLRQLAIDDELASRVVEHPNGATAMRALAAATASGEVGCTQITEIRYTRGVTLVGPLPAEFELSTVYSVAVGARSQHPDLARGFAARLAGPAARELRAGCGFE